MKNKIRKVLYINYEQTFVVYAPLGPNFEVKCHM